MSLFGFLLVLTAAFCHATWNVFVKRINGGPELIWLFSLVAMVLYAPMAIWTLHDAAPAFGPTEIAFIAGSAALHLGYFLLLQAGYRKGDLSLVYPTARATGPVLSTALALMFLGERLTPQMALGAGVIIFGVLMLTGGFGRGRRRNLTTSLLFGLGAGALIGSYTAWDAYAVSMLLVPPLILDYASSVARVILLSPIAWQRRATVRHQWQHHRVGVLAIAIFSPLAYILVLYALTFEPVAFVAPLREVSVVLTVLAGSLLMGEGDLPRRLGWACLILAGMAVLVTA